MKRIVPHSLQRTVLCFMLYPITPQAIMLSGTEQLIPVSVLLFLQLGPIWPLHLPILLFFSHLFSLSLFFLPIFFLLSIPLPSFPSLHLLLTVHFFLPHILSYTPISLVPIPYSISLFVSADLEYWQHLDMSTAWWWVRMCHLETFSNTPGETSNNTSDPKPWPLRWVHTTKWEWYCVDLYPDNNTEFWVIPETLSIRIL